MSQVGPCYFFANPLCSITRTVFLRLQRGNESWVGPKKSSVVSGGAEGFSSTFLRSLLSTPRQATKRQVQDSTADQAGSRTTTVSPPTATLSLTGGGTHTSSPTYTSAPSSGEPTSTPLSSTSTSTSGANTSSPSISSSSRVSITIPGTSSSVSTWTSSLDPPQSPSPIQHISTSRTSSSTTTETFTTEPSTSFSSSASFPSTNSPPPPSSRSSGRSGSPTVDPPHSSALPTIMSSLTLNSSSIPLTTVFPSTVIGITSTSVIVLPLPTSDLSSSSIPSRATTSSEFEPPTSSSPPLSSDSFPSRSITNPIPIPATITSLIPPPATLTTTNVVTIFTDGGTTPNSSVVGPGVLRTDTPTPSGFARNTGAVVAVALSVAVALILAVLAIFFTCKRYRLRSNSGSMENILALAREVSMRRPVDGEDDSFIGGYGGSLSLQPDKPLGRGSHSGEGGFDGFGGAGDQRSAEGGSAEGPNTGMDPPLHPTFGGQPYMPGYSQAPHRPVGQPNLNLPRYSSVAGPDSSQFWWGTNDPQAYYESSGPQNQLYPGRNRSAVSVTPPGSSTGGDGSSSGEGLRAKPQVRVSLAGPRPIAPSNEGHRSAPPTAIKAVREPALDYERQHHPEQSDKASFLSRLRSGRRTSNQSLATDRGSRSQATPGSKESLISPEPSNLYSPSLLNPPITIPPSRAILRVPHGVGGSSYAPLPPQMSDRYTSTPSAVLRPSVMLPPPPSPVPTDNSSMVEGLLHPRLGRSMNRLQQASTASLRDHEDYTRPINGLVNNHIRSTTTFEALDTNGPEEER